MKIFVVGFSNWLGYHLVEGLLNEGYEVVVATSGDEYEFFLDFFKRNSRFEVVKNVNDITYDAVISLGKQLDKDIMKSTKYVYIPNCDDNGNEDRFFLFGEWMPMNNEGIYHCKEHIPFSSAKFGNEAIYVADFVHTLLQWIHNPSLEGAFKLQRLKDGEEDVKSLENYLLLQENTPIDKSIKSLLSHYQKFMFLYPQI